MYEYLQGEAVKQAPTSLVLEVGGIGYFLTIPLGSRFGDAPTVRAWIHQVVREDSHTLYGFTTLAQRDLFRLLLTVRGVGPAAALMLLSGLSEKTLVEAILGEDVSALTRIKGVGKKTAEQILLDLRDRISRIAGESAFSDSPSTSSGPPQDERIADAISALVSIGYKEKEAIKLVEKAAKNTEGIDVEALVRMALQG
jgi:holliday junction DNA helicase RuvA